MLHRFLFYRADGGRGGGARNVMKTVDAPVGGAKVPLSHKRSVKAKQAALASM